MNRIRVRGTDSQLRTQLVIGELKTSRSRRTLFLTPQMVEMRRRRRVRQAAERMAVGEAWEDHGLIFPSQVGTPLDPDNVSHLVEGQKRAAAELMSAQLLRDIGSRTLTPRMAPNDSLGSRRATPGFEEGGSTSRNACAPGGAPGGAHPEGFEPPTF